jgi:putative addiction module component (TIGR02574 family)
MTKVVRELYEKASQLPDNDRAELAALLLESLEPPADPDVEEAWAREVEHRLAEYRAGRVRTIGWEELRAHLHRTDR